MAGVGGQPQAFALHRGRRPGEYLRRTRRMSTLLDTNIYLRAAQPGHPMGKAADDAVAELRQQGDTLHLAPQNLYEFWVAATRPPAQNGLGFTLAQAQAELVGLKGLFTLLDDTPAIFPRWERLVAQHQVSGKNAHDARLVAAMMVHGISRILTFNVGDWRALSGHSGPGPAAGGRFTAPHPLTAAPSPWAGPWEDVSSGRPPPFPRSFCHRAGIGR